LSSPNELTNILLDNLRQFTDVPQILRIGGLTQYAYWMDFYKGATDYTSRDKTTYDPNLKQGMSAYDFLLPPSAVITSQSRSSSRHGLYGIQLICTIEMVGLKRFHNTGLYFQHTHISKQATDTRLT
jgi:hypothetical protein